VEIGPRFPVFPISKEQSTMTSDNHFCCATDPAANPAECGAPPISDHVAELVEFGESRTEPTSGRIPPLRFTWGSFSRVMLGVATGMIVLFALFQFWSSPILGGVKKGSCCAPPARSETKDATGGDDCCAPPGGAALSASTPKQDGQQQPSGLATDAARNAVFRVQSLECPAVRGLGCGHLLAPELAGLDKLEGVERSLANRNGTMIRVTVAAAADREKVAGAVAKYLADNKRAPVRLAGDELTRVLDQEEWRDAGRIGELSAIEFHTLALHRVKTFAKVEKLDKEAAAKLVQIAEQQWERISQEAKNDRATQPEEWASRCRKSLLPVLLERVKDVLTAEQVERFQQTLTGPCRDEDRPEAPPAGTKREKVR
jgi:hypothetical protein